MRRALFCAALLALAGMAPAAASAVPSHSQTFQVDAAHDGFVSGAGVTLPLSRAWSAHFAPSITGRTQINKYVVLDRGRVFAVAQGVSRSTPHTYWQVVVALSLRTGTVLWHRRVPGNSGFPNLATDGGRLFVGTGDVEALDERSGRAIWRRPVPNNQSWSGIPTPSGGLIYDGFSFVGTTIEALRESNGSLAWNHIANNDGGGLVVRAGRTVLTTGACGVSSGFDALTGADRWTHREGCDGGGTPDAAFDGRRYWAEDVSPDCADPSQPMGRTFNPQTGTLLGRFCGYTPAFGYGLAFHAVHATVTAFDPASLAPRWTFRGDGSTIPTIPLVADGHVFVASARGRIWALNPHTGRVAWAGRLGTRVRTDSEYTQPGMAAGYGYLLVPTADGVVAFRRGRAR